MEIQRDELEQVKSILKSAPRGLTITEVSEKLQTNRNSVAKYLEMLLISGDVEMKSFGRSKIYRLSSRMPLATALSLSSELIVLLDGDLNVLDANDQFLRFSGLRRDQIVGLHLEVVKSDLLAHQNILLYIKDALNGNEYSRDISVIRGTEEQYFKAKLIPVSSGSAQRRVAVVYENITSRKKAELALSASEARYRAVVEDQSDLIMRMLPDTTITFVNESWCRFFGTERKDIVGQKHIEMIPPEYRQALRRDIDAIRVTSPSSTVESDILLQDGKPRWIQSVYRGVFDEKGRMAEVQIVSRDITDRKRAESALKESEARYRAVVEDQTDMILRMLPDTTITFVNPAWCRFHGESDSHIIGTRLIDFIPPEGRPLLRKGLDAITLEHPVVARENFLRLSSGGTPWVHFTYRGVFGDDGKLLEYQIVARDVTDRKQAEIRLKESEARYRAVVNDMTDLIVRTTPDMKVTFVSEACQRFWHVDPSYIAGKCFIDHLPPATKAKLEHMLASIRIENDTLYEEDPAVLPDGTSRWLYWSCRGIFGDGGRLLEYQIVARDVTERKRMELALKESEEKFRATFDQSPMGASLISMDFRFLRTNAASARILGYTEDELRTMTFADITHPDDRESDAIMTRDLIEGRIDEYHIEKRCIRKDGQVIWVRKHARLVKDENGKPLYLLPMVEDITENKRLEESLKIAMGSVDKAVDEVNWVDQDGRVTYVNEASRRRLGYTSEELIGKYVWDFNPCFSAEKFRALLDELRKTGYKQFESVHRTKDGKDYPVDVTLVYLPWGETELVCAYDRDISARKLAETTLAENEAKFRALFDQSPIGACLVSLDYRLTKANPELCHITGMTEAELIAGGFPAIVGPDDGETYKAMAVDLMAGRRQQYHAEATFSRKDGSIGWIRKNVRLVRDAAGKPAYYVCIMEDITEYRELLESLQLFRASVDDAHGGIMWVSSDGHMLYANRTICTTLKYTPEEIREKMIWDINPMYSPEKWLQVYREVKASQRKEYETVHRTGDGRTLPVKVFTNCLEYDKKEFVLGYLIYSPQ